MSESLHARIPSFDAPPSVGTALRVPTPPRGATLSPGHTRLPDAGQLADASASAASIDWRLHFHERRKLARARMEVPQKRRPTLALVEPRSIEKPQGVVVYPVPLGPHKRCQPRIVYSCPIGPHPALSMNIRGVIEAVAHKHRLTRAILESPSRFAVHVRARQECFWRLHGLGLSLTRIGALLKRDHTTILHGVRCHQRRIDSGEIAA